MNKGKVVTGDMGNLGYLVFWTLNQKKYSPLDLIEEAKRAGIPLNLIEKIQPKKALFAWQKSYGIEARGVISDLGRNEFGIARYLTRNLETDIKEDENPATGKMVVSERTLKRVLIRERVIPDVAEEDSVEVVTMAVMTYTENVFAGTWDIETHLTIDGLNHEKRNECEALLNEMRGAMDQALGMIDEEKIRYLLRYWLDKNFRISLRGNGGVYFVPQPKEKIMQDRLQKELNSVISWMNGHVIQGSLTCIEIFDSAQTTKTQIVESAVTELGNAVKDQVKKLKKFRANKNQNAGSRGYSAKEVMNNLSKIKTKMQVLEESLGVEIGTANILIEAAIEQSLKMQQEAHQEVLDYRQDKKASNSTGSRKSNVKKQKVII